MVRLLHKGGKQKAASLSIDWQQTFDAMSYFVSLIDRQYRIVRMNKAMACELGVKPDQTAGSYCYALVHNLDSPPSYCPFTKTLKDGLEHTAEVHAQSRLGGDFLITVAPWHAADGALAGCVHIAQNITERKHAEEELQRANELLKLQATTDMLTGICNRLKFCDFVRHEMEESRRYRHPLSLIMFDIDYFKQINDTYGHKAGDDVLREVAQLVSANVRDADIFARWGGEEFMILSPHNTLKNTRLAAEKLRALIAKRRYRCCPGKVTCSFGVAQFRDADTVDRFTERVDSAMYRAKAGGRNRVEIEH